MAEKIDKDKMLKIGLPIILIILVTVISLNFWVRRILDGGPQPAVQHGGVLDSRKLPVGISTTGQRKSVIEGDRVNAKTGAAPEKAALGSEPGTKRIAPIREERIDTPFLVN